jgi:alpha-tubulin suppressor-like RCC1 family protein
MSSAKAIIGGVWIFVMVGCSSPATSQGSAQPEGPTGGSAANAGVSGAGGSPADSGAGGAIQGSGGTGTSITTGTTSEKLSAIAVGAGTEHTCAVLTGGSLRCWGWNNDRMLGNGSTVQLSSTPVAVLNITNGAAVSGGGSHNCVLLEGGSIQCWGLDEYGQLGDGTSTFLSSIPVTVSGITNALNVSAGADHSCAVLRDGSIRCWGDNVFGALGDGTTTSSSTSVAVSGITNALNASAGRSYTCALLSDGSVKCWGDNSQGALGNGSTTNSSMPVVVAGITNASGVTAGYDHACALLSGGTVQCWGQNGSGALGNGSTTSSLTPVTALGITNALAASAGAYHACALLSGGTVQCWGQNDVGEIGNGTTIAALPFSSPTPVQVTGISNAHAISAGRMHTCALLAGGSIQCWGSNGFGGLGNGSTTDSSVPVTVAGF